MLPKRPFAPILLLFATVLWIVPPAAFADRVGVPYRGPVELVSGGSSQDTEADSGLDDGSGDSGGEPGSGDPGSGGGDPGSGGNDPGVGSGGGGGTTGTGGKGAAKLDGKIVWQWWWEYSKEQYLARASERGRVNAGSSYYWFGAGAKYPPRDIVPVSESQRATKVFTTLTAKLRGGNAGVRAEMAIALGRIGFVPAGKQKKEGRSNNLVVRELIRAAEEDQNKTVRESAILALGMTRDADAAKYLVRNFDRFKVDERPWANIALGLTGHLGDKGASVGHLVDQLPKSARSKDNAEIAAITGIGLLGPAAVEQLKKTGGIEKLTKLVNARGNDALVMQAVRTLSLLGLERKEVVSMATRKTSRNIKWTAILSLANYYADEKDADAAFKTLKGRKCFGSGDNQDKSFAVLAMGRLAQNLDPNSKLRDKILKFVVKEALEKRANNYTRSCAAIAVGIANDRSAIPTVAALLTDTTAQNHVVSAACVALGLLRATEHADTIRDRVLLTPKWKADTRGYAALGIALMGDTSRVDELKKFSRSSGLSKETRRQLPLALGLLGDKQDVRALIQFFAKNWKKNERYEVSNAAFGLGWIKDQGAVEQLTRLIEKSPDADVRAMAGIALGYDAAQERVSPLSALYENMNFRNRFGNWDILFEISQIL